MLEVPKVCFEKAETRHNGMVCGALVLADSQGLPPAQRHLGELNDVHPDFAAHIVKCVNTYAALLKVLKAEEGDGPITNALRELLHP